jgi:hypothetical protein
VLISALNFRAKTTAASREYGTFLQPRLPRECLSRSPRPKRWLVPRLSRPPSPERLPAHTHVQEPRQELSARPPHPPRLSRPSAEQDKLQQAHRPPSGEELSRPSKPVSLDHPEQRQAASPPNPPFAQQPRPVSTTTTQTCKTILLPNPNPLVQPPSQAPHPPSPRASLPRWIHPSNSKNFTAKSPP